MLVGGLYLMWRGRLFNLNAFFFRPPNLFVPQSIRSFVCLLRVGRVLNMQPRIKGSSKIHRGVIGPQMVPFKVPGDHAFISFILGPLHGSKVLNGQARFTRIDQTLFIGLFSFGLWAYKLRPIRHNWVYFPTYAISNLISVIKTLICVVFNCL